MTQSAAICDREKSVWTVLGKYAECPDQSWIARCSRRKPLPVNQLGPASTSASVGPMRIYQVDAPSERRNVLFTDPPGTGSIATLSQPMPFKSARARVISGIIGSVIANHVLL